MGKNILIVDDNLLNRLILKKYLKLTDSTILEAENGLEALTIIKNTDIHIIFMDIEMPVLNGIKTTEIIRNELPPPICDLPIIAVTAYEKDTFENKRFNEILRKPVSRYQIQNIFNHFTKTLPVIPQKIQ